MAKIQDSPRAVAQIPRRRRWARRLLWTLVTLVVLVLAAELIARFAFGLGNPPLHIRDDHAVFMFKPNQDLYRFGRHIFINAYGMRSENFPPSKTSRDEVRIMLIGDSVINGGAPTDQQDIVSAILERRLAAALHRPAIVGNISEGGWGPTHEFGYLQKYGFFDADILVIELSSHDFDNIMIPDNPIGVVEGFPDTNPPCALQELWQRYLIPRITASGPEAIPGLDAPTVYFDHDTNIRNCLAAVRDMILLADRQHITVIVAQSLTPDELNSGAGYGYSAIRTVAERTPAIRISFEQAYRKAIADGKNPFRDVIHPNEIGHAAMADALMPVLLDQLRVRGYDALTQPAHP